jgi:predicted kinase
VLLNGPPAIGKSTLARRYVRDRPLAFCLDLDGIRRLVGQWDQHEEASGLLARKMALAMAQTHLASGYDVVVPQYVARTEFIDDLAGLAASSNASFFEVYLTDDMEEALRRFDARADDVEAATHHREAVGMVGSRKGLSDMYDGIEQVRLTRQHAVVVPTRAGYEEEAYRAMVTALDTCSRDATVGRADGGCCG